MAKLFASKFNLDSLPDPVKPGATPEQASNIRIEPIEQKPLETQALNAQLRTVDNQKANISTSDEILEKQGVRKSAAAQYVSSTKVEPFGTTPVEQGSTTIKPPQPVADKTSDIAIKPVDVGSKIADPKIEVSKVDQGSKITNPNTIVQKIQPGDKITNPNTVIKPIVVGDRITNPNTIVNQVKEGDKITNPNITPIPVKAGELITDPNTVIKKVDVGAKITNPNIQPLQVKETDITKSIPNNTLGIGTTNLFPKTISLKNRLDQPGLGTTKHLPEYLLSDQNTGALTIKNPRVSAKVSETNVQKIQYENFVLKQGGVEDLFKGIVSTINPTKFGTQVTNQGSVEIKNIQTTQKKTSLVKIEKIVPGERTINPKIQIDRVQPGERTFDPNTKITPIVAGERTIDPNTKITPVVAGDRTTNPDTNITPIVAGDRTTDPKLKIDPVVAGDRITDPKLKIDPVVPGTRTFDPKLKIDPVVPGERTIDPKTKVNPVVVGSKIIDPLIIIPLVVPGERTFDPKTIIHPIKPGSRTVIPKVRLRLFDEVDDKLFYTQEPDRYYSDVLLSAGSIGLSGTRLDITDPYNRIPDFVSKDRTKDKTNLLNKYSGPGTYVIKNSGELVEPQDSALFGLKKSVDDPNGGNPTLDAKDYEGNFTFKDVKFPPNNYGSAGLPDSYQALSYDQIRARRRETKYRDLDFTVSDAPNVLDPWRQRLGMPATGADTINKNVNSTARDLVTIKIHSPRDKATLQFRSYLKNFSDSYTANHTDVNYVGRPDTLKVFKGTTRQLTLAFTVPVMSADELQVVYQKLEKLVKISMMGKVNGAYMQGPFLKLTVGGWCHETPVLAGSLKYETNPLEYSWDIQHEVPQIVEVSMDFVALADNKGNGFLESGTYIQYGGA